jgi:hypothetical protein
VFNSTTEFATRLQAHLSDKARSKTEAIMRDLERTSAEDKSTRENGTAEAVLNSPSKRTRTEDDDEGGDFAGVSDIEGSDMEVDSDDDEDEADSQDGEGDEQLDFVHRQPLVGKGMAATLALLKGSGELKKTDQLAGRAKDSRAYDPSSTDHGVKLEYRDEFGRKLTQKEAFRQLSYKFHGYGPSQKKKEKRLKVGMDTFLVIFLLLFCLLLSSFSCIIIMSFCLFLVGSGGAAESAIIAGGHLGGSWRYYEISHAGARSHRPRTHYDTGMCAPSIC